MDPPTHFLRRAGPALEPIIIFDTLIVVAFVILLVSVLVAWFTGVQRVKTWYLLQLSGIGYCFSFFLLVGWQTGPEPPLQFCAISAALIYAAPPMLAAAALFFVIELHLRLSSALFSRSMSDTFIYWVAWGIPICHGVGFWVSLFIGLSDVSKIKRDPSGVYCHILDSKVPTLLTGTMVIALLASMLLMEVFTIIHLVQQRATVRAMRVRGSDFPLPLFIRTFLYTVLGGFSMVMVDILMNVTSTPATIVILLAIIPLSLALVFGTQKELLCAVFLCTLRRNKAGDVPLSDSDSV
ncbi:hypothetical protein C8F01DRAFT_799824 [Mycena amicta]|nr:hypothetical protein C8F01DRAFT_799824 [Mycena amicta]